MMQQFTIGDFTFVASKTIPLDWQNTWSPEMDRFVGDGIAYKICHISTTGMGITLASPYGNYTFPEGSLGLISMAKTIGWENVKIEVIGIDLAEEPDPQGLIAQRRALKSFLGGHLI